MCTCCPPYIDTLHCCKKINPVVKVGKSRGIVCPPPCCPPPCCPPPPTHCCPPPCGYNPIYSKNISPLNCYYNYSCLPPGDIILYPSELPFYNGC